MTNDNWARQNSAIGIKIEQNPTPKSGWANTEGDSRWAIYLWVSWSPSVCALHSNSSKPNFMFDYQRAMEDLPFVIFPGETLDSISKFIYGRDPSFSAHVGLCDRVLSFCGATWRCPSLGWVVYQRLQWFIIKPIDAIDDFELMISPRISLWYPPRTGCFSPPPAVTSTWPCRLQNWSNDAWKMRAVGGWWVLGVTVYPSDCGLSWPARVGMTVDMENSAWLVG